MPKKIQVEKKKEATKKVSKALREDELEPKDLDKVVALDDEEEAIKPIGDEEIAADLVEEALEEDFSPDMDEEEGDWQ